MTMIGVSMARRSQHFGRVYPLRLDGKRKVTTGIVVSVKGLTID